MVVVVSDAVVADFHARLAVGDRSAPVPGRVVLGRDRLVLLRDDGATTVPLSSVFDLVVGDAPTRSRALSEDTVTVGYRVDDGSRVAVVEADAPTVERFSTLAYRVLLDGTEALVRHPATVGGRVTDAAATRERLSLADGGLDAGACRVDLSTVVGFERRRRTLGGTPYPTLSVRHFEDDGAVTSVLTLPSARRLNLLGRYIRLERTAALAAVRDQTLSEATVEALVGLSSGTTAADLPGVLGVDSERARTLLEDLRERGLVDEDGSLTPRGRVVVADRIASGDG